MASSVSHRANALRRRSVFFSKFTAECIGKRRNRQKCIPENSQYLIDRVPFFLNGKMVHIYFRFKRLPETHENFLEEGETT